MRNKIIDNIEMSGYSTFNKKSHMINFRYNGKFFLKITNYDNEHYYDIYLFKGLTLLSFTPDIVGVDEIY